MSPVLMACLGLGGIVLLVLLEVPIGVAMGIAGIVGFSLLTTWGAGLSLAGTETLNALSNADLATIPMFLAMGAFASAAGLSDDLYRAASALVGHRRGGLAHATVLGCGAFGSICGSSLATVATFTKIASPQMRGRGYSPELSSGAVAAGSTLASLIPPSIVMVIYAAITGTFIVDLFSAALIPAIVAIALQLTAVSVYVHLRADAAVTGARSTTRQKLVELARAWPVFALAGVVLGGIYGGVFTATEAASFGLVLTFAVALIRRRLDRANLVAILIDCAKTTATVYTIIIGAFIFSYFVAATQAPAAIVEAIKASELPYGGLLFCLVLLYLALGAIFDETAAMIVTMPFVLPLIVSYGGDPVWWGIINICVINLGMIIPPVGINVFVLRATAPEYDLPTIYRGVLPFIVADLVRLGILIAFPVLSLYVPQLLKTLH